MFDTNASSSGDEVFDADQVNGFDLWFSRLCIGCFSNVILEQKSCTETITKYVKILLYLKSVIFARVGTNEGPLPHSSFKSLEISCSPALIKTAWFFCDYRIYVIDFFVK